MGKVRKGSLTNGIIGIVWWATAVLVGIRSYSCVHCRSPIQLCPHCGQDKQFKLVLQSLPSDCVLSIVHFAEHYAFQEQSEIQEMHWHNFQIIILVHIMYGEVLIHIKETLKLNLCKNTMFSSPIISAMTLCFCTNKGARCWCHVARYPSWLLVQNCLMDVKCTW